MHDLLITKAIRKYAVKGKAYAYIGGKQSICDCIKNGDSKAESECGKCLCKGANNAIKWKSKTKKKWIKDSKRTEAEWQSTNAMNLQIKLCYPKGDEKNSVDKIISKQ